MSQMPHHRYLLQTVLLICCLLPTYKINPSQQTGCKKPLLLKQRTRKKMKQNTVEYRKMTLKGSGKYPDALLFNDCLLARGCKQLSAKKKYVNMHETRTLQITTVWYSAKERQLEWQFLVVVLQKSSVWQKFLVSTNPKNDLIRICEFRHASFLGSVPSKTATCCKVVEKYELKPKSQKNGFYLIKQQQKRRLRIKTKMAVPNTTMQMLSGRFWNPIFGILKLQCGKSELMDILHRKRDKHRIVKSITINNVKNKCKCITTSHCLVSFFFIYSKCDSEFSLCWEVCL